MRDGDTIVVGSMPIRLNGLAAPEWDEPGGAAATKAMIELVDGLTLRCELNGEHTGDRCVGICYLEGVDIAAEMVAAGLARELSEVQRRPIPRGGAEDRSSRRDDRADLPAAGVLP